MRIVRKVWTPVAGIIAIGIIVLCAMFAPGTVARAATGAPNIGNFSAGSVQCGGYTASRGFIPSVRLSGALETEAATLLNITTDNRWRPLHETAVRVWVNNVELSPISNASVLDGLGPGLYYRIPAWDGVAGHQPKLGVAVSNPELSEVISFSMAWVDSRRFDPIAVGTANEPVCTITSNPQPS